MMDLIQVSAKEQMIPYAPVRATDSIKISESTELVRRCSSRFKIGLKSMMSKKMQILEPSEISAARCRRPMAKILGIGKSFNFTSSTPTELEAELIDGEMVSRNFALEPADRNLLGCS